MKKLITLSIFCLTVFITNAQVKNPPKKANDSIKTEVVNVVTSYVPKVTDAFKIKQKPVITHTKQTEKKALEYSIFSVPVASTFIPKSGTMKKIDLGQRERLYPNYLSIGFGNNITPSVETYIRQNDYHDSELGVYAKFLLSIDPVANTKLSSTYYNANINLFYKQLARYFDWKVGLNVQRNKYSWYALPSNINFRDIVIDAIDESQTFSFYNITGEIDFQDSYIDHANASIGYFADTLQSSEISADVNVMFVAPLDEMFHRELNDLYINTNINFLGGKFAQAFENTQELKHQFITFGVNPTYEFLVKKFLVKLGAKTYFTLDTQNKRNQFFVYPDVEISYPVVKDIATVFIGASGDLETNSYRSFSNENPFISPTLDIQQTNEKYNAFGGVRGKLSQQLSYNIKGGYSDTEDKAFYTLNYSRSNGTTSTNSGFTLFGYEYGNSFRVLYDDVKTISVFGEVEYDFNKKTVLRANVEFNKYTLTNQQHPWNLPQLKAEVFGTYKAKKWYAGTNIFFVGERKGIEYENSNAPTPLSVVNLKSYIDLNLNGGYNFSDSFSVYLNLNNVLNNTYQRYTNFNVQGFQAMAGATWKFDSIF